MLNKIKKISRAIALASATTAATAGGFQLWEQDGAGIGDYHAGAAADTDNTGIEFYNPAGMVFMKRNKLQISSGAAVIPVNVKFKGVITQTINGYPISQPTDGWVSGDSTNLVPNFHLIAPINKKWAVGFGITTPFGLATYYPYEQPVDLAATTTRLITINLNPNVAYKINPWLAIGGGVDVQYGMADFNNTVPLSNNSHDENHLTSWGVGYNLGIYTQFKEGTSAGFSYRSGITQKATGTNTTQTASGLKHSSISATLPLPGTFTGSIKQQINPKWSVMVTSEYTLWDSFKTLTLHNVIDPNSDKAKGRLNITVPFQYRNTWNFAVGTHYWLSKVFMLKLGGGFDQTPTNDAYRDIRLPGVDRWAASIGSRILLSKQVTLDAGWTHFFPLHNAKINNSGPQGLSGKTTVSTNGEASMDANVVGAQLTAYFK